MPDKPTEHESLLDDDGESDEHRERQTREREARTVEIFTTSKKGYASTFGRHWEEGDEQADKAAYHLASLEAKLPSWKEAMRLARYPGAGDRDPRRMVLGLCESLSVMEKHVHAAIEALEHLSRQESNGNS